MFAPTLLNRREGIVFGTWAGFGMWSQLVGPATRARGSSDRTFGSAKRCVLVWLDGGPSHLETFDPKPEAAAEVRGPLGVVRTRTAGIVFGEGLQQLARRTDRVAVIRSMTSPVGEHNLATQYALSGHIPGGRVAAPAFLLPVATVVRRRPPLPAHVAVPDFNLGGQARLTGFLDAQAMPWSLEADPAKGDFNRRVWPESRIDTGRLQRRRALLRMTPGGDNPALEEAIDLLRDMEVRQVFDLQRESPATLARYGSKSVGRSCLLARRLLEAGVPIVTVNNKGWDTHERLVERLHEGYTGAKVPVGLVPSLDQAVAALLDDLQSNGLIEETLVVVMGEFGRTPKINARGGRDHWPRAYSVLLAGAGVDVGQIYGSSDSVGENADAHPVTPQDLVATLYHLLGIDPFERIPTPDGQQVVRVLEGASIVRGLLS